MKHVTKNQLLRNRKKSLKKKKSYLKSEYMKTPRFTKEIQYISKFLNAKLKLIFEAQNPQIEKTKLNEQMNKQTNELNKRTE